MHGPQTQQPWHLWFCTIANLCRLLTANLSEMVMFYACAVVIFCELQSSELYYNDVSTCKDSLTNHIDDLIMLMITVRLEPACVASPTPVAEHVSVVWVDGMQQPTACCSYTFAFMGGCIISSCNCTVYKMYGNREGSIMHCQVKQ